MNWKDPIAVRWYYCLKSRQQRARNRVEKRCEECRVPMETRGICEECKAGRRARYHRISKARLAKGATPKCLDCGRPCKVVTSKRCQRCHCRRAGQLRWTKGQAA